MSDILRRIIELEQENRILKEKTKKLELAVMQNNRDKRKYEKALIQKSSKRNDEDMYRLPK